MKDSNLPGDGLANATREEIMSALFANMIIQQSDMALMLLGQAPHPATGQTVQDFEAARMFIDQLEMLEAKTKGNLNKEEAKLLQQSLTGLRLAFVQAIEGAPASGSAPSPSPSPDKAPKEEPEPELQTLSAEESRKKFTKKY
jgi:hypothetical protein